MEKLVLTIPTLYGDHHTIAVRKILQGMEGISDLYVSSAWHQVSLRYDPKQLSREAIEAALAEHGYLTDEPQMAFGESDPKHAARHTVAHEVTGQVIAFAEGPPPWQDRPRWPIPGLEPARKTQAE